MDLSLFRRFGPFCIVFRFYQTNVVGDYHTATQLLQDQPLVHNQPLDQVGLHFQYILLHIDHRVLDRILF